MTVALCLDDQNGRLFAHRRQSRDRLVVEDLLRIGGGRLCILPFSEDLFYEKEGVSVCQRVEDEGIYFLENVPLKPLASRLERMIIYRWNRLYPADTVLDLLPEEAGLHRVSQEDFAGFAHERITKEVYEK